MKYPDYKWVDMAINGVHNRNQVVDVSSIQLPDGTKDCYRTVYRYPDEFKTYFDKNKSVGGYRGPVYADFFPIDIDNEDLEKAHETAKRLLNELLINYEIDLNELRLYFSGAKGFHIMIPATMFNYQPSKIMPQAFKKMAVEIVSGIKIDEVIYDYVRLFRFTNTINSKTGLYKIPVTAAELLNLAVEEIKELAQTPRHVTVQNADSVNEYLQELYKTCCEKTTRPQEPPNTNTIIPPKDAKLCYYKILEGVGEGSRDNAGLRLAVHLLKEYPEDIVAPMMIAWNQRNRPPLENKIIEKIVTQARGVYDFGCNDPVLSSYCNPSCVYKGREQKKRVSADKIYNINDAKALYLNYILSLQERKITLGYKKIDQVIRGIAPGEVCEVIARTGVGKTMFLLNVIKNVIVNQDVPVLFFSLEQPLAQIYERTLQISLEKDGRTIEKTFADADVIETYHQVAKLNYGKLYCVDEDYLTYEELKEFIELAAKEKIGQTPPLVCVDYLGRMKGGRGTAYEVTSELAKLLKVLAKELDIAVLYLHQTSRMGKTGAEPISLDMSRDSGVVEEAADFIIGMWRPEINDTTTQEQEAEELVIAVLKNRKGRLGQASYKFIKPYLKVVEWDEHPETDDKDERKEWWQGN